MESIPAKIGFDIEQYFSSSVVKDFRGEGFENFSDSLLLVPLASKNGWTGFLLLGPKGEGSYQEEDMHFITAVASLAGSALENAHLYTSLQKAYADLDQRLKQISALYEISMLINSSDDFDLITSLLQETLATGFGVKSSVLLASYGERMAVARCYGMEGFYPQQVYQLSPEEEACFSDNKPRIISASSKGKAYIFLPLSTVKRRVGAMLIFALDNGSVEGVSEDILNLLAIIASQIAPPLLLSQWIREKSSHNPFQTLYTLLQSEAQKAKEFGVGISFLYLKLNNLQKYREFYSEEQTLSLVSVFEQRIADSLPMLSQWIHYDLDRFLLIFTGVPLSEVEGHIDTLYSLVADVFSHQQELPIQLQTSLASYPDEGESLLPYIMRLTTMA
jgi:K+-sensing histidine kinase KdpD